MMLVELGCRAMLVAVLGVAAAGKLRSGALHGLVAALRGFGVPAGLARMPLAVLIVGLEATAAALLVVAPAAGYLLALGVIAAFTVGLYQVVRSGRQVACRCFGASTTPVGATHLVRNAVILVVICLGLAAAAVAQGAASPLPVRLVAVACGALGGAAIVRWDDLAYLVRPARAVGRR
jgi:hypothetical protein